VPVWEETRHLPLVVENVAYPENLGLFEALVVQQVDRSGDLRKECDPHARAGAVIGEPVLGCVPTAQIDQWVVRHHK
jgi:hypothetical protein